jgi:hypothetical protein
VHVLLSVPHFSVIVVPEVTVIPFVIYIVISIITVPVLLVIVSLFLLPLLLVLLMLLFLFLLAQYLQCYCGEIWQMLSAVLLSHLGTQTEDTFLCLFPLFLQSPHQSKELDFVTALPLCLVSKQKKLSWLGLETRIDFGEGAGGGGFPPHWNK